MPRPPRAFCPGQALHIMHRGNNRSACFESDTDFANYLTLLTDLCPDSGCALHAYALMTNHVHVLISPCTATAPSLLVKRLAQRYSALVNRKYRRTGTVWEGRYRASSVDTDEYILACYRYIELNPVRAGIVERPEDYRWSSHRANVGAAATPVLVPHASYLALASARRSASTAYRELFSKPVDDATLADLRAGRPAAGVRHGV